LIDNHTYSLVVPIFLHT